MSFSRQDDFPESTLADEDEQGPPWTRVPKRSSWRGRGNYRDSMQRQGGRGSGFGQRGGSHGKEDVPESTLNDDSDDSGEVTRMELQRRQRESGWGRHRDYPAGLFQDTKVEEEELGPSGTRDRAQSRSTGRGHYGSSPQRQGGTGRDPGQRDGSHGYRSPHLQQKWERERVDIDRGALVSIGRAIQEEGIGIGRGKLSNKAMDIIGMEVIYGITELREVEILSLRDDRKHPLWWERGHRNRNKKLIALKDTSRRASL